MKNVALTLSICLIFTGCASVNMAPRAASDNAKKFAPPSQDKAGVYIYRNNFVGKALKRDIWIDGNCVGRSAPDVFFHTEVAGGMTHKIATESEFSPNILELVLESGKNYFVRQYIKMGFIVGGSDLEQVSESQGKADIIKLEMAQGGECSTKPK